MDSSHIAILTLNNKSLELEQLKHTLEEEKRELEARLQQATTHIKQLHEAVVKLQAPVNAEPVNNKQPSVIPQRETTLKPKPKNKELHSYPETGSLRKKVLYALKELHQFSSTRDIANYIVEKEPNENIEEVIEQISKQLARYKKRGDIISKEDEATRFTLYGLPEGI